MAPQVADPRAATYPATATPGSESPTLVIATVLNETGPTGVQAHVGEVLASARRRGVRAVLVTPFGRSTTLVYPAIAARRALERVSGEAAVRWYRAYGGALLRRALTSWLARLPSAVVYAQCPVSAHAALRARRSRAQRVVLAVHFNGSQADEWHERGVIAQDGRLFERIRDFEARILPALDGIVYKSWFMRRELEERIPGLTEIPAAVVPNSVELPVAVETKPIGDLVTVGTLEPRKNQRFLLEVLASAERFGRRYALTLIGDGPDRGSLERLAGSLGVAGRVRFLGSRPDASVLVRSYRAFCLASRIENCPIVVLEAMAAGLPVFAPAVGGIPELVSDGKEGVLWPLDDPDEAARLLIRYLDDDAAIRTFGAAGRARVAEQFTPDTVTPRLFDFVLGPAWRDQRSRV